MYLSTYIQIPNNPGKIVRRKQGDNTYILYEVDRVYDPKRQFNVPKRVVIGKLVPDATDDMMQPNEKYFQLFPEARQSLLEPPCDELQALQAERELVMSQKILAAMKKSGRSYDELMTFLQAPKA